MYAALNYRIIKQGFTAEQTRDGTRIDDRGARLHLFYRRLGHVEVEIEIGFECLIKVFRRQVFKLCLNP